MTEQSLTDAIDALRARINAELDAQLAVLAERHQTDLVNVRLAAEREVEARRAAAPAPSGSSLPGLLLGIDAATSVSGVLTATLKSVASGAPRAALFVGPGFDRWTDGGTSTNGVHVETLQNVLTSAMSSGRIVKGDQSIAVPLVLDGTPVAVLYAEQDSSPGPGPWMDSVEVLARYASARLGYLTALRAAQARQRLGSQAAVAAGIGAGAPIEDQEGAARRYARLLVSEIKLYNEAAVREGRAERDLSRRLAGEIGRARRLYEERVPSTVAGRSQYFQQELVQTLADGNPSLLG